MKSKKAFQIGFKGRKFSVGNSISCKSALSKMRGLMFRGKNFKTSLLFSWKKPGVYPIHSFFCRKFLAVWLIDGKIIEKRIVEPWKISVYPAEKFDSLLEIPV